MLLGYNTNGMSRHALVDAIALLAEIGYQSVAITIDHGALSPREDWRKQVDEVRRTLRRSGMRSVIETGARFLLDPRLPHEPTLISAHPEARQRRIAFYEHAVRCAAELESDGVALWSGRRPEGVSDGEAMAWLVEGLEHVLTFAQRYGLPIAFEPEPGMFIDSLARFATLLTEIDHPNLKLTLDVGHVHCQGEGPIGEQVVRWQSRLVNVHIEDMRYGRHEHLMFGEGEIDFPPVLHALGQIGYHGGIHVELSRHSHEAPAIARQAFQFLHPLLEKARTRHE